MTELKFEDFKIGATYDLEIDGGFKSNATVMFIDGPHHVGLRGPDNRTESFCFVKTCAGYDHVKLFPITDRTTAATSGE